MTPNALLAPARLAGQPILRTQSDERLVDLVRAGSEPAFEAIVARYRRPLLRYCSRFLSEERAEDAVQQTFVRAYGAMRQSAAELSLRPWLYRIAHNTALNALRDRGLRHEQLHDQIDGVERPDQALERSQGLREVLSAVQELPERQRDAILLRELEGRSYDEIADELGVSGGAVRQLLNRARNTLRGAASAATPAGLALRIPWGGEAEAIGVRVAELCGTAGAGAVAAKVCATALVTTAVVGGGAAVVPDISRQDATAREERSAGGGRYGTGVASASAATEPPGRRASGGDRSESGDDEGPGSSRAREREGRSRERGRGKADGDDSSGRGSGKREDDDSSGGRRAEREDEDSSGHGRGGAPDDGDSSGKGKSGSGKSGSGSGSSGSGSSGSGSSGSGSSGSGSSGSGSSGSGSSGSGSSGSGSGPKPEEPEEPEELEPVVTEETD
jgi:RNA polymerase sigma factor (sigma-70 family)